MSSLGDMIDGMWLDAGDAGNSGCGCFGWILLLIASIVIAILGANDMLPW